MAIKFFNIRTKEVRVAETEPLISALWASSDHSPNITQGQDFGWRLAPEVVVAMKKIKQDVNQLQVIASRYGLPLDAIGEKEVLQYISDKTAPEYAPVAVEADYTDEYEQEIRRLELEGSTNETATTTQEPVTTTTTQVPEVTTTTTEETTTTTTEEDFDTTTTTTEDLTTTTTLAL